MKDIIQLLRVLPFGFCLFCLLHPFQEFKFVDQLSMTRVMYQRSSRRKPPNSSQEETLEDCKENVPVSHKQIKKVNAKNTIPNVMKENISPNMNKSSRLSSAKDCLEYLSPVRRLTRGTTCNKKLNKLNKEKDDRNVLCDKTNTPGLLDNMTSSEEQISEVPVLKTIKKNNKTIYTLFTLPELTTKTLNKNQVPVYKSSGSSQEGLENVNTSIGKKEAIYEFEVDENEEPVQKKKRKKRVYNRKPKIGPRALTINNIKYSSSESLVSLPEKPIARKKRAPKNMKTDIKSLSCVNSLTNTEDTCSSISSFCSHPPSLELCKDKQNQHLSVLLESQSEHSPHHTINTDHEPSRILQQPPDTGISSLSAVPMSQDIAFSPNPRCYSVSKNMSLHRHRASPCPTNSSSVSSQDFLSSTPCKRVSAVINNNSMFEDSLDLPNIVRQSFGSVKYAVPPTKNTVDNCFGFDEPEELEEPLVSPIKYNIDLGPKLVGKRSPPKRPVFDDLDNFKPSTQEVIEMLKASIPKDDPKQGESDVFDLESENIDCSPSQTNVEEIVCTNMRKPPRRSYERQRRIRHCSTNQGEESENDDDKKASEKQVVEENVVKGGKKCYKRTNTTRSAKPVKVTKAKQREAKEVEEIERLAAMMNAQFQEIDKVSLVVE